MADNSISMELHLYISLYVNSDSDDSINLESKVLLALLRLRCNKTGNKKSVVSKPVSCKKVVDFLKANYSWLDGDIRSQVRTVLLSFVKIGIVCALENAKYRLLVPNPKSMNSSCLTRPSHGPHCCCLFTLNCNLNTTSNFCCLVKNKADFQKKAAKKRKKKAKSTVLSCGQNLRSGQTKTRKLKTNTCGKNDSQSSPCSESVSKGPVNKPCSKCNPNASKYNVPFDKFSPRDEVSDSDDCIKAKS